MGSQSEAERQHITAGLKAIKWIVLDRKRKRVFPFYYIVLFRLLSQDRHALRGYICRQYFLFITILTGVVPEDH